MRESYEVKRARAGVILGWVTPWEVSQIFTSVDVRDKWGREGDLKEIRIREEAGNGYVATTPLRQDYE